MTTGLTQWEKHVLTVAGKLLNPLAIRPALKSIKHLTLNEIPSRAVNRVSEAGAGSDFSSRSIIKIIYIQILNHRCPFFSR